MCSFLGEIGVKYEDVLKESFRGSFLEQDEFKHHLGLLCSMKGTLDFHPSNSVLGAIQATET